MNKLFLILLFTLSLFWGCTKDTPIVIPDPVEQPTHLIGLDSMMFRKNGEIVKIKGRISYYGEDYCSISTDYRIIAGQSLAERLGVQRVPLKKGNFLMGDYDPLNNNANPFGGVFGLVVDELVGTLATSEKFTTDYIEVIEVDTVAKTVEGRFQFHLINKESTHLQEYGLPDSLNITEGVFYLKLQ